MDSTKHCPHCKLDKPESEWTPSAWLGKSNWCRACQREYGREYYWRNREWHKRRHIRYAFGITDEQIDELWARTDGHCTICGVKPTRRLSLDHDEEKQYIRGLVCQPCNGGMGQLRDSPELLRRAADYLEASPATGIPMGPGNRSWRKSHKKRSERFEKIATESNDRARKAAGTRPVKRQRRPKGSHPAQLRLL